MGTTTVEFATEVSAPPEACWRWITSLEGMRREMTPYLRMTAPSHVHDIASLDVTLGKPLFRSWILLFGIVPIDYSCLTLVELRPGEGFVEQSPMGSMKTWRHERGITAVGSGAQIRDRLTFEPRFASSLVRAVVKAFLRHRHAVIKQELSTA